MEERVYHGVEQEIKKIRRQKVLTDKEKVYFESAFLRLLNQLCLEYQEAQCFHLLLLALTTLFFRIQDDTQTHLAIYESIKILAANKKNIPSIWAPTLFEKVMEYIDSAAHPKYKTVLVDLLVQNCQAVDH